MSVCLSVFFGDETRTFVILYLLTLDNQNINSADNKILNRLSYVFQCSAVFICNMSKTSASFSSGVPNTEKEMKARGRRPSAFFVSRCLEPLMKNEARVFDMASQTSVGI